MHPVYEKLVQDIKATDAPVIMFDGYSGTGYAEPEHVKVAMNKQILRAMVESGSLKPGATRNDRPIYVVAGATDVGIGAVYGVADALKARGFNVRTVGIVSENANKYPGDIHSGLDYFVDIKDPDGTWQVLKENGDSYMIDVLKHSSYAKASFMGGGKVAKSEMEDLEKLAASEPAAAGNIRIEVRIGGGFSPDPIQVQKQIDKAAAKGQTLAADDYQFYGTKDFEQGEFRGAPKRESAEAPVMWNR